MKHIQLKKTTYSMLLIIFAKKHEPNPITHMGQSKSANNKEVNIAQFHESQFQLGHANHSVHFYFLATFTQLTVRNAHMGTLCPSTRLDNRIAFNS